MLQQLLLTLLTCVVANSHVAMAQAESKFPSLFMPLSHGDPESVSTASALMLQLPSDVKVVRVASGTGGKTPNVMFTRINHQVLAADPTGLSLVLPGVAAPVQVNQIPTMQASANMANPNANDNVWYGEVVGKPGGMSVVTMLTQDYRVYGNVRYYDQKRKAFRTFKIMPKPGTNTTIARLMAEYQARQSTLNATIGPDGNISYPYPYTTPPANTTDFSAWANTTYTAQALDPQQQKQDYIVVEYKEPTGKRTFLTPPAAKPTLEASSTLEGVAVTSTPAATAVAADAADTNATANSGAGMRKLQQISVVQDLLIVYTQNAANKAGGEEALKAAARNAVGMTNKAYADSGINLRLSLVDIRLVSYNEFSRSNSGDVLRDLTDGRIPNVWTWRDQLGADLVSLFHMLPDVCGVAWVAPDAKYGYSTVNNGCWNGYTLGHELGHNQGCGHNFEDNDGRAYRYGWRWCNGGSSNFKTIMSYRCTNGAPARELGYFATPKLYIPAVGPIGDATRGDCARAIAESATTVALHRPSATNIISGTIAIRGGRLGKYCADDWTSKVICNRDSAQAWERFRVENVGPNKIALRGGRQGYYCADDLDRIICNRNYASPGPWEIFTVESLGPGRIALRGGRQNLYCADDQDRMICNRGVLGAWETLTVERL